MGGYYEAVWTDETALLSMSKDKCTQACKALNKPVAVIYSEILFQVAHQVSSYADKCYAC